MNKNTGPPLFAAEPAPAPPAPVREVFNWNTLLQRVIQAVITAVGAYLALVAAK